jgi:hypothetical protein
MQSKIKFLKMRLNVHTIAHKRRAKSFLENQKKRNCRSNMKTNNAFCRELDSSSDKVGLKLFEEISRSED